MAWLEIMPLGVHGMDRTVQEEEEKVWVMGPRRLVVGAGIPTLFCCRSWKENMGEIIRIVIRVEPNGRNISPPATHTRYVKLVLP